MRKRRAQNTRIVTASTYFFGMAKDRGGSMQDGLAINGLKIQPVS
jgi:hypothetical protein